MQKNIEIQALTIWKQLHRQHRLGLALQGFLVFGMIFLGSTLVFQFFKLPYSYVGSFLMGVLGIFFWISKNEGKFKSGFLTQYLNHKYNWLEFSSQLISENPDQLFPQLQRQRILQILVEKQKEVKALPDLKLISFVFIGLLCVFAVWQVVGFSGFHFQQQNTFSKSALPVVPKKDKLPSLEYMRVSILPPVYTRQKTKNPAELSFEAPEKSSVVWQCKLTDSAAVFQVIWNGNDTVLVASNQNYYTWDIPFRNSLFYQFRYGNGKEWFVSPVYTVHAIADQSPVITVQTPAPYTLVLYGKKPEIKVALQVTDDYGLAQARLVATVSRGSGESVKFKETELKFQENIIGKKSINLSKTLDFNSLQMEPGDELYFYAETWDEANPPNKSRSEMYFVQWEDTTSQKLSVMAGISLDNMPAYFRSQRQIIIDTEKLLSEKKNLSKEEFQKRSNELGIDQKILRLRYGQFLGEEFETNIGANPNHSHDKKSKKEQGTSVFKNLIDSKTKDPASRTVNQDSIIKHYNPADHQKEHEQEKVLEQLHNHQSNQNPVEFGVAGDMLRDYEHRHDIEESATFFDETMKAQLKAALAQMWDSELRLRTMRPEEALPYEYKALELIKALQQKSRVYVEKTGFKPPTLKPAEKRLTGELDEIKNPQRTWEEETIAQVFPNLRKAANILEKMRQQADFELASEEKLILEKAGNELTALILKQPGIKVSVLNDLRRIITNENISEAIIKSVQQQLVRLLPKENRQPGMVSNGEEPELEIFINKINR